jgi:branched-chain amino acid aminotransferase
MNIETNKEFFIYNNELSNNKELKLKEGEKVYEVIRVINGVPLFLEEHIERLKKSIDLIGYSSQINEETLRENIYKLISKNDEFNMNIKIILNYYGVNFESVFFFIKSNYPEERIYDEGVVTITIKAMRDLPNVKKVNNTFKTKVKEKLKEKDAYEALLIDEKEYITEGSRSNMFFIKGNEAYTAPKGEVLLGVTRANILKACESLDVNIVEKNLKLEELNNIDGIFMSGTSVGVLPIKVVDDIKYNSAKNTVIKNIRREYNKRVDEYIKKNKNFLKKQL